MENGLPEKINRGGCVSEKDYNNLIDFLAERGREIITQSFIIFLFLSRSRISKS